jgi:TRAP-type transport system periplasmic protein
VTYGGTAFARSGKSSGNLRARHLLAAVTNAPHHRNRIWIWRTAALGIGLTLLVSVCGSASASTSSGAKKTYIIKTSTTGDASSPDSIGLEYFAQQLKTKSHGQLQLKIYYDSTFAAPTAVAADILNDSVQLTSLSTSYTSSAVPQGNAFTLPFMFDTINQANLAMDGAAGKYIDNAVKSTSGLTVLGWFNEGFGDFISSTNTVTNLAGMSGKKMRIIASTTNVQAYEEWGAVPVAMDSTDVYTALEQGTISGLDDVLPTIIADKFYEVAKHLTVSHDAFYPEMLLMNSKFLDSLPANLRAIILKAAPGAVARQRKADLEANATALQTLKSDGEQVVTMSPAVRAAFRKALAPLYTSAAAQYGSTFMQEIEHP